MGEGEKREGEGNWFEDAPLALKDKEYNASQKTSIF